MEILCSHQEKSSFALAKIHMKIVCKQLKNKAKVTDLVMKPLLRHFRGQTDLKTVV